MDNGLDITRTVYKSGYCIFGFDKLPLFVMGSLNNEKKMKLCEQI